MSTTQERVEQILRVATAEVLAEIETADRKTSEATLRRAAELTGLRGVKAWLNALADRVRDGGSL